MLGLHILQFSFQFGAFDRQLVVRSSACSSRHSQYSLLQSFFFDQALDATTKVLNSKAVLALVVVDCADEIVEDRSSMVKINKIEAAIYILARIQGGRRRFGRKRSRIAWRILVCSLHW